MAISRKTVLYGIGLFALLFVGIPVKVNKIDAVEEHFVQFIQTHNKLYEKDSPEYLKRLANFRVGS